jgi:hypothetical protein
MTPRSLLLAFFVLSLMSLPAGAAPRLTPDQILGLQTPAPTGTVVVKFKEGLRVDASGLSGETPAVRGRVLALLSRVAPGVRLERGFRADQRTLGMLREAARARARGPLPALESYARLRIAGAGRDRLLAVVKELAADPAVETAFLEPVAVPAALGFDAFTGATPAPPVASAGPTPAVTPDFSGQQGYRTSPPTGVGATDVVGIPGSSGASVQVIDIEGAWLWSHEDLPAPSVQIGTQIPDLSWRNHGTAVLGEIRGVDNGLGVLGIAPACAVGASSVGDQSVADALLSAAAASSPGDVILIELHAPGPNANGSGQFGYVPMEFWQDNFDAIQIVTAAGFIVCEAAGNGQQNLDDPVYQDLFDRDVRDSGAILCGASSGSSLTPAAFSNNGTRVDLHGWGFNVTTCGYGVLQGSPLPEQEWYTNAFSGTSSASPIVVGAVVALQGMVETAFGFPMDAELMRHVLTVTGTPQNPGNLIGPRPDLADAWALVSGGVGRAEGAVTQQGGGVLEDVRVEVLETGSVASTSATGEYGFSLLTGSYTVEFSDFFHQTASFPLTVAHDSVTVLDAALELKPLVELDGRVRDRQTLADLSGVRATPLEVPVGSGVTGGGGLFSLGMVPQGNLYPLLFDGRPGHGAGYQVVNLSGPVDVVQWLPTVFEDFESGPGGFTADTLWSHGTPADGGPAGGFDGTRCFGVGMTADYPDTTTGYLTSPSFDFSAPAPAFLYLSFHYWSETEDGFDGVNLEAWNGSSWEVRAPLEGYTDAFLGGLDYRNGWAGSTGDWVGTVFDFTDLIGADVRFRLRFGSDPSVTADGFWVDGFAWDTPNLALDVPSETMPPARLALSVAPNPVASSATISWRGLAAERAVLQLFDVRGRLVRTFFEGAAAATGRVDWNGRDDLGRRPPRGVYWAVLRADGGKVAVQRLVLTD